MALVHAEGSTFLGRRALVVARLVWLASALLGLVLFVAGNMAALREPPPVCANTEVECDPLAWNAADLELMRAAGFPPGAFGEVSFVFNFAVNLAYIGVGALIFWRKSSDWVALLLSLTLLMLGAAVFSPANGVLESTQPAWRPLIMLAEVPTFLAVFLLIYVFPDGRFRPQWAGIICALALLGLLVAVLGLAPLWAVVPVLAVSGATAIYSLVYRYRYVSGPLERQQMKWMALGLMAVVSGIVLWVLGSLLFPPDQPNLARAYFLLVSLPVMALSGAVFPICVAIAILRYRLWDIDLIIRRTLVYSLLTAMLALIYFGSVVLLQSLFQALMGQASQIAIVLSTLAIAALFNPLRKRIQAVIDHRFYRRNYDAAKTLDAFGAIARDEVDLEILVSTLMQVVEVTVQPAQLSLWLAPSAAGVRNETRPQSQRIS